MGPKAPSVVLAVLLVWSSASARADEDDGRDRLTRAIREMRDRLARVRPKPEGFVEPPDPTSSSSWCRLEGTIRIGETPLAGSRVSLLWVSKGVAVTSRVASVTTTSAGAFVFPRVPLGKYRMIGVAEEREWEYRPTILLKSPGHKGLDVSLSARKILVTVLGQDLKPVAGANVSRENPVGTFMSFVTPGTTDSDGRTTIGFLAEGLNDLRASVGDVSGSVRVYGLSDVREVRIILPPFGTVEVLVKGWNPDKSLGFIALTCVRDGLSTTLGASIDASGRAVMRCSPGRWKFSLKVVGRAAATPAGGRTLSVRAGETTSIEVLAKSSRERGAK